MWTHTDLSHGSHGSLSCGSLGSITWIIHIYITWTHTDLSRRPTRIYHVDHMDLSQGSYASITWITCIYHVDHTSVYSRIWKLPVIFSPQMPMYVRCVAMRGAPNAWRAPVWLAQHLPNCQNSCGTWIDHLDSHGYITLITRIYHVDYIHGSITWITRIYHVDPRIM